MSSREQITILLVEDNPDLRAATEDLLGTLGYRTVTAGTAAQALEVVPRQRVDLVIANAYPHHGSGLETVDALRAELPRLPALLVSGFGDDLELRRRVMAGEVGFLSIPFSADALRAGIEETLAREPVAPVSYRTSSPATAPAAGSGRRAGARSLLAAAAVILVAGLAFRLVDRAPELAAPETGEIRRGFAIELLAPIGEIEALPETLSWRESPNAVRYRVALHAVDDSEIWATETGETTIALPAEVIDRLHSAVSYSWQVEGFAQDSTPTGRSGLVAFRSAPRGPA